MENTAEGAFSRGGAMPRGVEEETEREEAGAIGGIEAEDEGEPETEEEVMKLGEEAADTGEEAMFCRPPARRFCCCCACCVCDCG